MYNYTRQCRIYQCIGGKNKKLLYVNYNSKLVEYYITNLKVTLIRSF